MSHSHCYRLLSRLILLCGTVRTSRAQRQSNASCEADTVRRRVCAVDDSLSVALIRADTSALARLYADDLVSVNYRGVRSTKAMLIAAIAAGRLRFDRYPAEVDYRRTYVRRENRWQLVAAAIGVVPSP